MLVRSGNNGGKLLPRTPANVYDPNESITQFALKFEVSSSKPIGDLLIQTSLKIDGVNYQIDFPLSNFIKSSDGKWYTITVPLADYRAGTNGFGKYADIIKTEPEDAYRIIFQNPTGADIPATLGIDNIRIVRL